MNPDSVRQRAAHAPASDMSVARGSAVTPPAESAAAIRVASVDAVATRLQLELASESAAREYTSALASLLYGSADSRVVVDEGGRARDDLEIREIVQRVSAKTTLTLQFALRCGAESHKVTIALDSAVVSVTMRTTFDGVATDVMWLQAEPDHLGALPVVALAVRDDAFSAEALQPLVALATRTGGLRRAEVYVEGDASPRLTWSGDADEPGALQVAGSHADAVWVAGAAPSESTPPAVWCSSSRALESAAPPPAEWWSRFDDLARAATTSVAALENHLRSLVTGELRWRLEDIAAAHNADFMTPVEDGLALALVPKSAEVVVAVDLHLPPEVLQPLLLHAIAHLVLGHVRPGDASGHWDTAKTAVEPHRHWDREARDYLATHLKRKTERRIESLDDCTPTEKAQLGLWRMIGEMLGESRRLHPAAERYQQAAYQRQAAQRLISMLEDYGGAMLCDGVGLGKTYVATAMLVHYANEWRDKWAATPDRLIEDPFRITIIAPHSVVSTWRREALPGLAAFGVALATVRVISHSQLSRVVRASELLEPGRGGLSDLEHLLLSDLVVVDEAHNFRSLAARRTKVLRDLLRVQPRREQRRRVVLLTATPINNSLDDLRQEVSLLFSKPLWLSDKKTDDGYRRQAIKEVQERCGKARTAKPRSDVAPLIVHGNPEAPFADAIQFRDDLDFGPNVERIGDYLKEQDRRLKELQDQIRAAAQLNLPADNRPQVRIAEDLLDRVVVQRSRALCKEIERQQSSTVELLFRPDAGAPEKLRYSDEYDGIEDVLAGFLPLFGTDGEKNDAAARRALSFKIYMWYDVRAGVKSAEDTSSVVGLQRVLVLKRLESSPVSFLITLLRLTVLHAYRLQQLGNLCANLGENGRAKELQAAIDTVIRRQDEGALEKIRSLAAGSTLRNVRKEFIRSLSDAHAADRPAADPDDPPPQMSLFEDESAGLRREELERLWPLREAIIDDFETLLEVTPGLADIVFGKFAQSEWPRRFIAGGEAIDWPTSPAWGQRLVTDGKIRQLVARLIAARRANQKVVVFSQFSDTVAYIQSVLRACKNFARTDWQVVVRGLGVGLIRSEELTQLLQVTTTITGATEDRDEVVNAFAPYYRIGPGRPASNDDESGALNAAWEASWSMAMLRPVDVLLSTDVLAEGVNLQDAALLINYDVHWNPVRMIQRAGRIDRRLNPRIEHGRQFEDLTALAARLGREMPHYYWHDHARKPPVTVNMILPDELEDELLLRERIATKTLAIDFTLGLEQGTGAEADWMSSYKYQGITSLNSLQRDRAIEQIGGHHERLTRLFAELGVRTEWAENLNGWFRCRTATDASPLVGRALVGRRGGDLERFTRYLEPAQKDSVTYWFWAEKRPGESMFDGWLVLDGRPEHFPPRPRRDIPFHDNASTPVRAAHLLGAAEFLAAGPALDVLPARDIGRPLMQGASALAAPKLGTEEDRSLIAIRDFYLLQLPTFEPQRSTSDVDPRESSPTRSSASARATE